MSLHPDTPDPTLRFTDRAADYDRYRPGYPAAVLRVLEQRMGLDPSWVVADVGSGTGISAELFLDRGHTVWAVEPNDAMRAAAERRLGSRGGFRSVSGTAEHTGLADESVDVVACAQAFHWFDPAAARVELARVLRAPRWVALLWNTRHTDGSAFLEAYEALVTEHGTDYAGVRREWRSEGSLGDFYLTGYERAVVPNEQVLDWEGLRGRTTSASYLPGPGHPGHEPMLRDLRALFEAHREDGEVRVTYDCEIYTGRLGPDT